MKKSILLALVVLLFSSNIFAQQNEYHDFSERGEVYFSFHLKDKNVLNQLSRVISIDKADATGKIIAYANERGFKQFLELGIKPEILTPPSMQEEHKMLTLKTYRSKSINEWNAYPTYDTYLAMMHDFQTNFPELCETIEFGTTVRGRKLLICKLSSPLNSDKKAKIHYSSTMHGDECTGYVLMLRLIDYLLNNYETDSQVKNILDHAEVWICPNANPDGTYRNGNNSVTGATRYNGNFEDLNRNYKDFLYGAHPDDADWQPETEAFMALQSEQKFHLGMNLHGGAEVCNYPWDNQYTLTADDAWWRYVCKEYVDTARILNAAYMKSEYSSGITNGAAWYVISGSRQDYANYYDRCREWTLEISTTKTPSAANLPKYWNYNYRSFLNFLTQGLYGIHGTVTDSETGLPLNCSISIENHDLNNSQVFSDANTGYYVRPIKAGTYRVTYAAKGYDSETKNITVVDKQKIVQNVQLQRDRSDMEKFEKDNISVDIYPNPAKDVIYVNAQSLIKAVEITDLNGRKVFFQKNNTNNMTIEISNFASGVYLLKIDLEHEQISTKIVVNGK